MHLWAAGKEAAKREVWAVREDRGVEGRGRRGPLAFGLEVTPAGVGRVGGTPPASLRGCGFLEVSSSNWR